jgi:hypothetical protein
MGDIERAFAALNAKQFGHKLAFQYYDGEQPLIYSTDRLREAFDNINARFSQNWCAVVVDSVLDRLSLKGITAGDTTSTGILKRIFSTAHVELDSFDVHQASLVTSEGYIIVWKDDDGTQVFYNDPRLCHVFYDQTNPKKKSMAAKWWLDENNGACRLNIYYEDRIDHFVTTNAGWPSSPNAFLPADPPTERNEYGVIPVFHFRIDRRNRSSELHNIITLQDAVNKLFADMMVAAEFGAFKQRYVISSADTAALKNAPNEIWSIPAAEDGGQQTSVGEFDATDLNVYLNAMDKIANSIAIITRTPKHYFFSAGSGISGEALLAMEAPLVKKVKQRQEAFSVIWQEIGAFILKLETSKEVDPSTLTVVWEPAGSIQPYTEAQARKTSVDAGIPLNTQLRREGWSADEIAQMEKDKEDEDEKQTSMASALLERARIRDEQTNKTPTGNRNQSPVNQPGQTSEED